jgi:hypothetical protein
VAGLFTGHYHLKGQTLFQTRIDGRSHLWKVPRGRWISPTRPMWLWDYSSFIISSLGSFIHSFIHSYCTDWTVIARKLFLIFFIFILPNISILNLSSLLLASIPLSRFPWGYPAKSLHSCLTCPVDSIFTAANDIRWEVEFTQLIIQFPASPCYLLILIGPGYSLQHLVLKQR